MSDSSSPQRQSVPARAAGPPPGSPAQQAFRLALETTEALRAQLHQLRASQATTRQTYWRQVGPVAAATVAARRALYEPLETALTSGYLSRAEEQQVTELLVHNARSLQERFGEDEAAILTRYAPPLPPPEPDEVPVAAAPARPTIPPHEQAASTARARRQQRKASPTQPTDDAQQALLQNTKLAYRQLARLHHPDRAAQADAATQQAQTEIMQRITAAYAAGDLAALLSLLATADAPAQPGAAAEEAEPLLMRYAEALAGQQAQLRQALETARRRVEDAPWSGTEKQQRTRLREIKRSLRAETEYLNHLGRQLREPTGLRQLLRELASQGQGSL